MTHFAGRAGKVLFLSVLTAMLLAATALAADIATGAGCTTGSSLRLRAEPSTSASRGHHAGQECGGGDLG